MLIKNIKVVIAGVALLLSSHSLAGHGGTFKLRSPELVRHLVSLPGGCKGILLENNFVLTAYHCVYGRDLIPVLYYYFSPGSKKVFEATPHTPRVIKHPKVKRRKGIFLSFDFAIIDLEDTEIPAEMIPFPTEKLRSWRPGTTLNTFLMAENYKTGRLEEYVQRYTAKNLRKGHLDPSYESGGPCLGDSGSAVFSSSNELVGVISHATLANKRDKCGYGFSIAPIDSFTLKWILNEIN